MQKFLIPVWIAVGWIFFVSAGYSVVIALFPVLGIPGLLFGFGILLNMAAFPSGLVFLLACGARLISMRTVNATLAGGALIGAVLLIAAYFAQITLHERTLVLERAREIAARPVEQISANNDTAVIFVERIWKPRCAALCARSLFTRSIGAYVVGYRPNDWQLTDAVDSTRYREYRLGRGAECAGETVDIKTIGMSNGLALYEFGGLCITTRNLDDPPDGVWVYQDRDVLDRPNFKFDGALAEIHIREDGVTRLLVHYESGSGYYQGFPPMFLTSPKSRQLDFATEWSDYPYRYGERTLVEPSPEPVGDPVEIYGSKEVADRVARIERIGRERYRRDQPIPVERLLERVTGLSFPDQNFPDSAMPFIVEAIQRFDRDYTKISETDRLDVLASIGAVFWRRPELFDELEPLFLRAAADNGPVAAKALRILMGRNVANRERYLPIVLTAIDNPGAYHSVLRALLTIGADISEADLLRVAKISPDMPEQPKGYSVFGRGYDLFKLLDRHGRASEATLTYLLTRSDYPMKYHAARRLIGMGRQDLVLSSAAVFRDHLEAFQPSSNTIHVSGNSATWTYADHQIMAGIGLKQEARDILKGKLNDPAMNDNQRMQLKKLLSEL